MDEKQPLYIFQEETCIVCGAPIPEGRQNCLSCEETGYIKPAYIPQKPGSRRHKAHALSTWDAGKKWGISKRQVAKLCEQGKILNAYKENGAWYIPEDAEKPADMRKSKSRILRKTKY